MVYFFSLYFVAFICTLEIKPSQGLRGGPRLILPLSSSSSDNPLEGKSHLEYYICIYEWKVSFIKKHFYTEIDDVFMNPGVKPMKENTALLKYT